MNDDNFFKLCFDFKLQPNFGISWGKLYTP
jgi:hypothetical protein